MGKGSQIHDDRWKLDFWVLSRQHSRQISKLQDTPEIYVVLSTNITATKKYH